MISSLGDVLGTVSSDCEVEKDWENIIKVFPDKNALLTKIKNKRKLIKLFKSTCKFSKNSSLNRVHFTNTFVRVKIVYCSIFFHPDCKFKKSYLIFGNLRTILNFIEKQDRKNSDKRNLVSISIKKIRYKSLSGKED